MLDQLVLVNMIIPGKSSPKVFKLLDQGESESSFGKSKWEGVVISIIGILCFGACSAVTTLRNGETGTTSSPDDRFLSKLSSGGNS